MAKEGEYAEGCPWCGGETYFDLGSDNRFHATVCHHCGKYVAPCSQCCADCPVADEPEYCSAETCPSYYIKAIIDAGDYDCGDKCPFLRRMKHEIS